MGTYICVYVCVCVCVVRVCVCVCDSTLNVGNKLLLYKAQTISGISGHTVLSMVSR